MALDDKVISARNFESSGSTQTDSKGSNDATVIGATYSASEVFSLPGFNYDGSNDYLSIADSDDLSFTDGAGTDSAFSINTMVNADNFTGNAAIFAKGTDAAREYQCYFNTSGNLVILLSNNGGTAANRIGRITTATYSTNTDYMVTFTYDGTESSSGIKIYVNGSEATSTAADAGTYNGMANTSGGAVIGRNMNNGTLRFDGGIGPTTIFNEELVASEVSDIYNSGSPLTYPFGVDTVEQNAIFFGMNF